MKSLIKGITLVMFAIVIVAVIVTHNKTKSKLVPLEIKLPKPMFVGTEKPIRVSNLKKFSTEERPPFLAPEGTTNVALGKPVSSSDKEPIIGELEMITDGDKEAADGSYVELGPSLQHITIDLEGMYEIFAVAVWHYHQQPQVYFDVTCCAGGPGFDPGQGTQNFH